LEQIFNAFSKGMGEQMVKSLRNFQIVQENEAGAPGNSIKVQEKEIFVQQKKTIIQPKPQEPFSPGDGAMQEGEG
jgi:hypothetical protein